jgi:hypothetical protein
MHKKHFDEIKTVYDKIIEVVDDFNEQKSDKGEEVLKDEFSWRFLEDYFKQSQSYFAIYTDIFEKNKEVLGKQFRIFNQRSQKELKLLNQLAEKPRQMSLAFFEMFEQLFKIDDKSAGLIN